MSISYSHIKDPRADTKTNEEADLQVSKKTKQNWWGYWGY